MDEHREGEKPVPPWERPGCFRMDCEPHRAGLLRLMGTASLIASYFSIPLPFPFLVVGLPLSGMTWLMARSDLAKIQKGLMHPGGEWLAIAARKAGLSGLVFNLLSGVGWGALCLVAFLMRG
jgi:hypothetical protein